MPRPQPQPQPQRTKFPAWPVVAAALALIGYFAILTLSSGHREEGIGTVMLLLLFAIGVFVYFIPTIIAERRGHPKKTSIQVVNFFLGWTLVGWVVALAWAVAAPELEK